MSKHFKKLKDGWVESLKVKYLKAKNAKMCRLEAVDAKINTLTSDKVTSNDVTAKNIVSENLAVTNTATVKSLVAENGQMGNLQVVNLNGKNFACQEQAPTFNNINSNLVTVDPLVYPPNSSFDRIVWDNLVLQTLRQKDELAGRLQCGRLQVKYIQDEFGCVQCPPDELQNCTPFCDPPAPPGEVCGCPQESGACPSVPLNIFGIQSFPTVNLIGCGNGPNPQFITQLLSSVSYNLDVVNVTGTLGARTVTVLVQSGHIDGNGDFVYNEIDFGTRQFTATLDTAYGEKYTGTIALDTDFIKEITAQPNTGAMVQLVVFAEEGVDIDIRNKVRGKSREANAPNGAVDATVVTTPAPTALDGAYVLQYYTSDVSSISRLTSTVNIKNFVINAAYNVEFSFNGDGDYYTFLSINYGNIPSITVGIQGTDKTILSTEPAAPYVKQQTIPDADGVSKVFLMIANINATPFPNFLTVNTTYEMVVERTTTDPTPVADWKFSVINKTTGDTIDLGTAKMDRPDNFISGKGLAQRTYNQSSTPTYTCDTYPQTVAVYGVITTNSTPAVLGNPEIGKCGPNNSIQPNAESGTVTMTIGNIVNNNPKNYGIGQIYEASVENIASLSATLTITLPANNTRWGLNSFFPQPDNVPTDACYLAIQTDSAGNYEVIAEMGRGATATPGGPYVNVSIVGEQPGGLKTWRLSVANSAFANFIQPNLAYELAIKRGNTDPGPNANWTFTVKKISTGETLTMGTISTVRAENFLSLGSYQESNYITNAPIVCSKVLPSTALWSFVQVNSSFENVAATEKFSTIPNCTNSKCEVNNATRTTTISIIPS